MLMHYIAALGNPGAEYEATRHNAGRLVLARFLETRGFPEPVESKQYAALVSEGVLRTARGTEEVLALMPETYMNKSGSAVAKAVAGGTQAGRLIVAHDDIDLPVGRMRLAFGRGSGGHRGVESVARALKTRRFARLRVGIAATTPSGKLKKPRGERAVLDFVMGRFTKREREALEALLPKAADALEAFVAEGVQAAMNRYN